MKINTKLTLAFLLISLLAVAVTNTLSYFYHKKILTQGVLHYLGSVASLRQNRIGGIIDQNLERLLLVSSRTQLRLSMESFIRNPKNEYQDKMNKILLDACSSISSFKDISVLTLDGEIVASIDKAKIGKKHSDEEFFIRGKIENSADIFFLDENKNLRLYLSGPLYLKKKLLGVVVIESDVDNIVSTAHDYTGLRETGETLLAERDKNGDALFITSVRFDQRAALRRTVSKDNLSAPITQALLKKEQIFTDAVDYRGEPVLTTTKYIEKTDWGLVVKIDKAEAFAPIVQLRNLLVLIIFVSSIGIIFISLYIARSIARPIINLTQVARKIGGGDLSQKVEVTSTDEIGILAQTFNEMTNNLRKSYMVLEEEIAERKRAEEALKEAHRYTRGLIEASLDAMMTISAEGKITDVNQATELITGMSRNEIIGTDFSNYFTDPDAANRGYQQALRDGYARDCPLEIKHRDGKDTSVLCNASVYKNEQGYLSGVFIAIRDITERKRLEEHLLQSQKMEAIGQLAGGVAHDFNNLLTAIIGYSELLLEDFDNRDPSRKKIEKIRKAGEQAALLTRQLLTLSRRQVLQPKVLDLNAVVTDTENLLRRLIGEDINLVTVLEPALGRVKVDPGQIEQVIMNLAVNARDAMPEGGELTIKTENVTLDEEYRKVIPDARPGKFIRLSVEDTGIGMDKEIIQHIFEPFFTTKESGKGTGLGLSTVYGIVKQHKGWINVYSEPGQGSIFKVYLPAVSAKPEDSTKGTISAKELKGNGERILLVEDEEGVREFATGALRENGYLVFEAADAKEALETFEREKGNFHLVLTDMVLSDKSGLQLVDQLLSRKPKLRVLLSSGYTDQKSQWAVIRERGYQFLQKPYSLHNLLQAIRKAIGSSKKKPER